MMVIILLILKLHIIDRNTIIKVSNDGRDLWGIKIFLDDMFIAGFSSANDIQIMLEDVEQFIHWRVQGGWFRSLPVFDEVALAS
jgi:hypothetical protein